MPINVQKTQKLEKEKKKMKTYKTTVKILHSIKGSPSIEKTREEMWGWRVELWKTFNAKEHKAEVELGQITQISITFLVHQFSRKIKFFLGKWGWNYTIISLGHYLTNYQTRTINYGLGNVYFILVSSKILTSKNLQCVCLFVWSK